MNDQKAAFVEAARRDPNFKKDFGVSAAAIKDNPDLLFDIAEKAFSRYEKSGFEDKTDVNKTAKNLMDKFISVSESPDQYGGVDIRPTMRSAADQALNLLKSKGIKLTMADLQAILWYPEKDVWAALTRESAKSAPTDYRTEMIKLAQRKHGLTDQQIQQAIGKK